MIYYALTGLISFFLGVGSGYFVFSGNQADLKPAEKICGSDKTCALYISCLIVNSRESGGQNPRNCDALLEVVNFSERNRILQGAFDYCEKKDGRDAAALCREYVRPK